MAGESFDDDVRNTRFVEHQIGAVVVDIETGGSFGDDDRVVNAFYTEGKQRIAIDRGGWDGLQFNGSDVDSWAATIAIDNPVEATLVCARARCWIAGINRRTVIQQGMCLCLSPVVRQWSKSWVEDSNGAATDQVAIAVRGWRLG